ncbi:MAG: hypothetical protein M1383_06245 [Patescibacteria group bacterium]|nr:hypothetical protein [Patescibacteria group bacterium]
MSVLDKPHRQAAERLLAEMREMVLADEVTEILYRRQLLRSPNKQLAEQNLKMAQTKIAAEKILIQNLEELLAEK